MCRKITDADGQEATYEYDGRDLVRAVDVSRNTYAYTYDDNHNLIRIGYADGDPLAIIYEPDSQQVASVTKPDGKTTRYEYYSEDPEGRVTLQGFPVVDVYGTRVTKLELTGKEIVNQYDFEIGQGDFGVSYTARMRTVINGLETVTEYSQQAGLPLRIQRGDRLTEFAYTDDGLLTRKISSNDGETTEDISLEYHPIHRKITRVEDEDAWTEFRYDQVGNLVYAADENEREVKLFYNDRMRINQMIENGSDGVKSLTFEYDDQGKPTLIRLVGVGEIFVEYNQIGSIQRVYSTQGHKVALQVTRAFQRLLSLVKPAGVNLSL